MWGDSVIGVGYLPWWQWISSIPCYVRHDLRSHIFGSWNKLQMVSRLGKILLENESAWNSFAFSFQVYLQHTKQRLATTIHNLVLGCFFGSLSWQEHHEYTVGNSLTLLVSRLKVWNDIIRYITYLESISYSQKESRRKKNQRGNDPALLLSIEKLIFLSFENTCTVDKITSFSCHFIQ